ncbi:MAG TPA: isoprenylcysteine carboxylmethyltransferase family protein [Edaphobacter sp.]|jgi:protein-S-isoprenylcysteine O-methyltransferase Ste14
MGIRFGAMYLPLMAVLLACLLRRNVQRRGVACLLSLIWAMVSLLALQRLNRWAGWWTFEADGVVFCGMPLELYVGWVLLWGAVPELLFVRTRLVWVAVTMVVVDLLAMPLCTPVVMLGPRWLAGEMAGVLMVLLPSLCLARWTVVDSRLRLRAAMQVVLAGGLILFFLPETIFGLRPGQGWAPLIETARWARQLWPQVLMLLALPGVAGVMEFAERGEGTPIPYDPPKRLVQSGIYRYIANPMQLSCVLVMLVWAGLLRNGWMAAAAGMSVIYSAGLAKWDEAEELKDRFGEEWMSYRSNVRSWWPRWRPYYAGAASRLYMAATCGPCSELRSWLEAQQPMGLEIVDAESLPAGSIERMRYMPRDGSGGVEGVKALGCALEHLNLSWALVGIVLRMPIIRGSVQLVMDASGLGPRVLRREKHCTDLLR